MSKPAVIAGVYVDCRFMPGLKSARISIDIPIEKSNEFLKAFGAPDRANPVHVAVARLEVGAYAPEGAAKPEPVAEPEKATGGGVERKYSRSQIAAMKLQDREFQDWLWSTAKSVDARTLESFRADRAAWCDREIKGRLVIISKRELDHEGPRARAFEALLTDYDMRNTVR